MSYNFKSKKIIISAGATGIGWATAKECLEKGTEMSSRVIQQIGARL